MGQCGEENMKSLCKSMFVLCFALLAPAGVSAASLDEQVKAAYAAWDAAFNKADGMAVAAFYTGDSLFLPASHDVIKGPGGVEKFFVGVFEGGVSAHKLELIEAIGNGAMVVAAAKWSAKAKDKAVGGVATHVFVRQGDGKLKLKLHTFN
jgi:ketosteroid isomerase-like protein